MRVQFQRGNGGVVLYKDVRDGRSGMHDFVPLPLTIFDDVRRGMVVCAHRLSVIPVWRITFLCIRRRSRLVRSRVIVRLGCFFFGRRFPALFAHIDGGGGRLSGCLCIIIANHMQ